MAGLPKVTPMKQQQIKHFVVYFTDGSSARIEVDGGEGFFKEEVMKFPDRSLNTFQAFVAGGKKSELPSLLTR